MPPFVNKSRGDIRVVPTQMQSTAAAPDHLMSGIKEQKLPRAAMFHQDDILRQLERFVGQCACCSSFGVRGLDMTGFLAFKTLHKPSFVPARTPVLVFLGNIPVYASSPTLKPVVILAHSRFGASKPGSSPIDYELYSSVFR